MAAGSVRPLAVIRARSRGAAVSKKQQSVSRIVGDQSVGRHMPFRSNGLKAETRCMVVDALGFYGIVAVGVLVGQVMGVPLVLNFEFIVYPILTYSTLDAQTSHLY